jgi:hypothetical protein
MLQNNIFGCVGGGVVVVGGGGGGGIGIDDGHRV